MSARKIALPYQRKRPKRTYCARKIRKVAAWFQAGPLARPETEGQKLQSPVREWRDMTPEERVAILDRLRGRG